MADTGNDPRSGFDPLDADEVYAWYCESCRRLGVEPSPRERAGDLIAEWSAVFQRGEEPLH